MKIIVKIAALFTLAALAGCTLPQDPANVLKRQLAQSIDDTLVRPQPGQDGVVTAYHDAVFVQCRQSSDPHNWHCEAAGTQMQPSLDLTDARQLELLGLGYHADPAFGNDVLDVPNSTDPSRLAETMVRTLTLGYRANPAEIMVDARRLPTAACPPRVPYGTIRAGAIDVWSAPGDAQGACTAAEEALHAPPPASSSPTVKANAGPKDVVTAYTPTLVKEIARLRRAHIDHVWITLDGPGGRIGCRPALEHHAFACEASTDGLAPDRMARLKASGFPKPQQEFPFQSASDAEMARLMLTILRDVYGFNSASLLNAHDELGDVTLMPAK